MGCRTAYTSMVAARDGALGARRRRALDRHLEQCESCRAEQVAVEDVLAVLDRLPTVVDVPARLEQQVMRRVRALAEEEPHGPLAERLGRWLRSAGPALAAGAVAMVALVGLQTATDHTPPVAKRPPVAAATRADATVVARGPKTPPPVDPPPALASQPDLYVDLPVLRNLDKLRHYDSIATMEGDDPTDDVIPPSNG
jgi:hypothetical protein